MNLSRKFLKALGIEDEKIDNIIEAHMETVNALKEERDGFQTKAKQLDDVQKQLDDLKAKGDDGYKAKYEEEKRAHDALKDEIAKKERRQKNETEFRKILSEAGIRDKYIDTILKAEQHEIEQLKVEEGAVANRKELLESLKTKWSDFVVTTSTKREKLDTPPAQTGTIKTTAEIMKIKDKAERLREFEKQIMAEKGIE